MTTDELTSRRRFLSTTMVAGSALAGASLLRAGEPAASQRTGNQPEDDQHAAKESVTAGDSSTDNGSAAKNKICIFTKPLQKLTYQQLAETVAELGCDGIEATVRRGGHVLPERVEDDLPRLVEALDKHGVELTIATSDVNRVDQPHAAKVLQTAAALKIPMYRMAYYRYDLARPVAKQLDEIRPVLADLVDLNRQLGITAVYQNHSGDDLVGAPLWDLHLLLKEHSPQDVAAAFDIGHATVEGGLCWPVQVNLLQPFTRAVYVKDFAWRDGRVHWVPLGEGRVDRRYFKQLAKTDFAGPISLHVEYIRHDKSAGVKEYVAAFRRDLATLKQWL